MPKIVGGVTALVALITGIFAKVDSWVCLERAALALALGAMCGYIWQTLLSVSSAKHVEFVPVEEATFESNTIGED